MTVNSENSNGTSVVNLLGGNTTSAIPSAIVSTETVVSTFLNTLNVTVLDSVTEPTVIDAVIVTTTSASSGWLTTPVADKISG